MRKLILATSLFCGACTTMTPEQKAALVHEASRPVTCLKGDDCDVKWSRATQWVKNNSTYKFQAISDNVIQTMGPLPNSSAPAFTVTKVSNDRGLYTLDLDGGCDNGFGCNPSMLEAQASFVYFVMGPEKGASR